ncbi:MAG: hypothetical protein HWE20_01195 [Gammaproteobacteria bacterium]|nr:hypothetical protein [Gammaproteobacteria bacterium]
MQFIQRHAGRLALTCFAIFFLNTLIGKMRVMTGNGTSPPIDGVPEFGLLALATLFTVIWILKKEQTTLANPNSGDQNGR